MNQRWKIFLEQECQKEAHAGIKEYYESYGASVPACGITPEQEWMRDTRGLIFMDVSVVAEAFLHHEMRRTDESGCFPFQEAVMKQAQRLQIWRQRLPMAPWIWKR
ncbi:hypothetical protein C806_03567 [Lachnospiraceae bacterium 3-1]|nr:hypothetical protein C806_03567 [Lachnospiraceae bacterium 3-1]